jgi:hypothetical protein
MKFEKINDEKFAPLTQEQLSKLKGGTYTATLTYNDVRNDKEESDRDGGADL